MFVLISGVNAKLYCFVPQPEDVEVKYLGQFRIPGNNACLVNKSIYSFGEEDGTQAIEEFCLTRQTFTTLWFHKREEEEETAAFCLNQSSGCFPLPKYY